MAKRFRRTRHLFGFLLLKTFVIFATVMPRNLGFRFFGALGYSIGLFLGGERKKAATHIQMIYKNELSSTEIKQLINRMFWHLGITLFDAIKLPSLPKEQFWSYVAEFDKETFEKAASKQKGIVALTGHLSCFELQSQLSSVAGFKALAVGAKLFDKRVDKLVENLRSRNGVEYQTRDGSGRKLLKALKKGALFGSLIDQDTTDDGVFAHFLGELAFTPTGPITLAYKFDIPLLFATFFRDENYKYHMVVEEHIFEKSGDKERDILHITEAFNSFYSEAIKAHPEQWVWMHRRWKRQPSDLPHIPNIENYPKETI